MKKTSGQSRQKPAAKRPPLQPKPVLAKTYRLAYSAADKYWIQYGKILQRSMTRDDLKQDFVLVLINAIQHFDRSRGFRFSSYAHGAFYNRVLRLLNNTLGKHSFVPLSAAALKPERWSLAKYEKPEYEVKLGLLAVIHSLPVTEREKRIYAARNGLGTNVTKKTLRETGKLFGISIGRVQQITEKVDGLLRKNPGAKRLFEEISD